MVGNLGSADVPVFPEMDRVSAGLSAALRTPRLAEHEALLDSLTPDEWTDLVDVAIRQRVGTQLPETIVEHLPGPAAARLTESIEAAGRRTQRFKEEFLNLAAAVESQGIRIVALKGIYLALGVYPATVVREMADVDVLVRHDDLESVAAAAYGLGYGDRSGRLDRAPHHLPPLVKSGGSLEIHWRLAEPGIPPTASPDELFSRVRPLAGAGNAFGLAPEDALIHVCAHAAYSHHFEQGMRPLCDLRALIAACGAAMDWDLVVAKALEWHSSRGVVLALSLARDLLGVDVSANVIARLGGAAPASVSAAGVGQVFGPRTAMHAVSGPAGQLLGAASIGFRLRTALRALVLPPEQIAALYPGWSPGSPLLRAWVMARRAADLSKRYAWILLRTAWRPQSAEGRHIAQRNELRGWLNSG
jgi:Uncharacterised nucleotidyltransferase